MIPDPVALSCLKTRDFEERLAGLVYRYSHPV